MNEQPPEMQETPLIDAMDHLILMHRDVHFGGDFETMTEYYQKGGKGAVPDFDELRIRELSFLEQQLKQNLAALVLSGEEAERVALAKNAYKALRSLYEGQANFKPIKASYPRLVADLVLSEDEEPEAEIAAIVAEQAAIVPSLITLLRSEDLHDPLFPGYGLAPRLATECLKRIGDKRAIISLFETIGDSDFFNEDLALDALKAIGEPAKTFLLKPLHARPFTYDNERAAIALSRFKDDPEVAIACFTMLKQLDLKKDAVFANYLVLACEGLKGSPYQAEFIALAEASATPSALRQDIKAIAKMWKSQNQSL